MRQLTIYKSGDKFAHISVNEENMDFSFGCICPPIQIQKHITDFIFGMSSKDTYRNWRWMWEPDSNSEMFG